MKIIHRLLFLFLTLSASLPLQARSLEIEDFHADIMVRQQGDVVISEQIRFRFEGSWNGIYRLIPVIYQTPRDPDFHLDLSVMGVTDGSKQDLRYEVSREGRYRQVKVWVPNATDTSRSVIITYRVENALQFFEEYDELYWNVTGDEWNMAIQKASATLHLPENVTGIRTVAFTGSYGSREEEESRIRKRGNVITFETLVPLAPYEGLTVAASWNSGVVERPTLLDNILAFAKDYSILILPLIVFIAMFRLWQTRGKDPRKGPLVVQYEPPANMTPAEVGTLIDHYPHMQDLTATIVDLAVRGFLRIEEIDEERLLGLWTSKSYQFRKLEEANTESLRSYERTLLDELFPGTKEVVKLSDLKNSFYKHLSTIREEIFDQLIEVGHYKRRPDKVKVIYVSVAGVLVFLTIFGAVFLSAFLWWNAIPIIAAGLGSALVIGIFGWLMPARTKAGARTLDEIRGFEEFLEKVEQERFKRMITSPAMFEKYLPFAMALGQQDKWAEAFEDIFTDPPKWYAGSHMHTFRPSIFVSDLQQLSTQTQSALSSSPRSSGGSSFGGGGGFSGGGFGGGGGGGF